MQVCHHKEEVKTMYCPMKASEDTNAFCDGADCMAWRWVETHIRSSDERENDLVPSDDTHGFCGMACTPRIKA